MELYRYLCIIYYSLACEKNNSSSRLHFLSLQSYCISPDSPMKKKWMHINYLFFHKQSSGMKRWWSRKKSLWFFFFYCNDIWVLEVLQEVCCSLLSQLHLCSHVTAVKKMLLGNIYDKGHSHKNLNTAGIQKLNPWL